MNSSRSHSRRRKRRKGDTDQLAAQLAPLEEQNKRAAEHQIGSPISAGTSPADRHFGAIIVDNEDVRVSTDIMETPAQKQFLGMEPVVLVVLILMLSFIAFITWQISLMPAR